MANITNTQSHVKPHTHQIADVAGLENKFTQITQQITAGTVAIEDNLTSEATNKALSAKQGKVLDGKIQNINAVLQSDDTTLDTLQEIVNKIKANKSEFDQLTADNLVGLDAKLAAKQDKATLEADVAAKGFIKAAPGQAIPENVLPANVVKYDAEGDITTKQAVLNTYEDAEVPTSKAVKDAIGTAKGEAISTAATTAQQKVDAAKQELEAAIALKVTETELAGKVNNLIDAKVNQAFVENMLGMKMKPFKVSFSGNTATVSDEFIKAKSDITWSMENPNGYLQITSVDGTATVTSSQAETSPIFLFVTNYTAVDGL